MFIYILLLSCLSFRRQKSQRISISFMSQDLITKGYFGSRFWLQHRLWMALENSFKIFHFSPFHVFKLNRNFFWKANKIKSPGKISIVLWFNFLIFKCPSFEIMENVNNTQHAWITHGKFWGKRLAIIHKVEKNLVHWDSCNKNKFFDTV